MMTAGCLGKLLSQATNQDINNLGFGLVHSPVKVVEKHLLRQDGPLSQAEQFEDAIFPWGQVDGLAVDGDNAGIEIDGQLAGPDRRSGVTLGPADDRQNSRGQLATIEGLGQEVVGTEAEKLDPFVQLSSSREDYYRRVHTRCPQPLQHLVAVDVRQHQVEEDNVVIVNPGEPESVLAEIGRITKPVILRQGELDAGGR
jgi:hypothetical protein